MTGEIWTLLGIDLVVMLVVMSLVAIPSFRTHDPSYVDGVWGLGFVVVAYAALIQSAIGDWGDTGRRVLLVGLAMLWGLRLGIYLLRRWRRHGPDPRYQQMLKRNEGSAALYLWTRVFLTQAVLLTIVGIPLQLGQVYDDGLTWWNLVGVAVALFGIAFEAVADAQLSAFKRDPDNEGQVMDRGLWRYSRHPNYFGEACTWWGIGLLAWSNAVTLFAFIGPVVITFLLLKVSGVGLLEKSMHKTKPKYADYVARTSAFVPLPPKASA